MSESIDDKRIFDGAVRYSRAHPGFARLLGHVAALERPAGRPLVVGVTGPGGSGKTTTARNVSEHLTEIPRVHVPIMHADDFYPDTDGSQSIVTADWHTYDRITMRGLLEQLRRGQTIRYPSLNWIDNTPGAEITIKPHKFVIVEGVGLLHPDFRDILDFSVWTFPGSYEESMERGIKRMGEDSRPNWERFWTPSDRAFGEKHHPEDHADFIFDTSSS